MSVLDFQRERTTTPVFERLMLESPAVVSEARSFFEHFRDAGVRLSFTDAGLERLDELLRSLGQGKMTPHEAERLSLAAGSFLGCLVIERVGGAWRAEEGGWVVAGIGPRNYTFDPFEPTHLLLAGRGEVSLAAELHSLREDARGYGPRTRFETLFEDTFRRVTGREPGERSRGFSYRVGPDEWVFLHNIYRRALGEPGDWPAEIENFVRKLEGASLEKEALERDVESRILPTLRNRDRKAAVDASRYVELAIVDDLVLAFALDHLRSMAFLTEAQAARFGLDAATLRRTALANLGARNFGFQVDAARGVVTVQENDGYDAARVLLPGFAAAVADILGPEVHIALPHRDLLVAYDRRSPHVASVLAEVTALCRSKPYALSPRPYRLLASGELAYTGAA